MYGYPPMFSRAQHFCRRGFEAQQRAAQASEEKIRDMFQIVAEGWFELAEQEDRRDRQHNRTQSHTEAVEPDDKHTNRFPMACRPVPTSRPQGLNVGGLHPAAARAGSSNLAPPPSGAFFHLRPSQRACAPGRSP